MKGNNTIATTKVAAPGESNDQRKQIGLGTDLAKHSSIF
jgi:hypothetical protein